MVDGHDAAGKATGDDNVENGRTLSTTHATSRVRRWRWWMLPVAVVLVVAVVLATFGVLRKDPPVDPARSVAIVVFLDPEVTTEQKDAIGSYLGGLAVVGEVRFESREDAFRRFVEIYADQPDLVAQTSPASLPESFRLTLADRGDLVAVKTHLVEQAGVDGVTVPSAPVSSPDLEQPWRRGEVTVFLRANATAAEAETIAAYLRTLAVVDPVTFEDRNAAYQRLVEIYRGDQNPNDQEQIAGIVRDKLPESFRLTLVNPADAETVKEHLRGAPGVDDVVSYQDINPSSAASPGRT